MDRTIRKDLPERSEYILQFLNEDEVIGSKWETLWNYGDNLVKAEEYARRRSRDFPGVSYRVIEERIVTTIVNHYQGGREDNGR